MKNKTIMTIILAVTAFVLAAERGVSYAEESKNPFSLGFCSFLPATENAKTPAPGVLTAKYGFSLATDFKPYVGTGLAYSFQPESKPGDTATSIKAGVAGQAGFNFLLGGNTSLNFDYKCFYLSPDTARGDSNTPAQSLGLDLKIRF